MTTQPVDPTGAVARLGEYRLHGVLGEGGMGVVHLGTDPSGRAVAVKVLRDHVAHDPVARARLAREVSTLRRVDHPAVAPFLGADVDGPRPYLVTRYVPGEPLDAWVREHGPLHGRELRDMARTLADALDAIHAAGVVHRDLKPGNVLVAGGSPVVIDFGIAHVADESRLTSTGLVMGTPGYLPPELLDGQDVSPATDLWGYAATLAFAGTGRPPFGGGRTEAILDRVRRGASDLDGLEPWMQQVVRAGLDPDPAGRPSLGTIRRVLEDPASAPRLLPPLPVPSRGGSSAVGAAATEPVPSGGAASAVTPAGRVDAFVSGATAPVGAPRVSVSGAGAARPVGVGATEPVVTDPDADDAPSRPLDRLTAWASRVGRPGRSTTSEAPLPPSAPLAQSTSVGEAPTAAQPVVATRVMPAVPTPPVARPTTPAGPPPQRYATFRPEASAPVPTPARAAPPVRPGGPWTGRPAGGTFTAGPYGASPAPVAPRPVSMRGGTVFALGLLLVALTAHRPGLGILVALGWSWLARFVDRVVTSVLLRRAARGRRDTDVAVATLASPWHLVGSGFSALVAGVVPVLVGAGFVVGLRAMAGDVVGLPVGTASRLMVGAAAAAVVAWWGPGGSTVRRGTRTIVRSVAPGRAGAVVLTVAAVVSAAVLALLTQSTGWELTWWPLDGLERLVPAAARALGL
ncbi:serine/threonine-protein kinase [Mobilicoccus pelagius]|uniref:Putative serine/threonine protein kinase n=1 Tax=Mobilicoccus pelagius NBRC 104925 TaxID=1089455 RepID=H5URC9_9MICO|nr:serine/threonine-protein kinase [Mobilicoccus pelagius]GAB48287.1 putative serine/threonine protein kinase [Mobilicoccus pelagius NBRC 104925]